MKRLKAFLAASIITGLIACGMLVVGVNAVLNRNGVTPSDSLPSSSASAGDAPSVATQTQVAQLQDLVKQYQAREAQYHAQLDQAQAEVQNYQQVLTELQNRGVIQILSDGRILLRVSRELNDNGG